MSKVDPIMLFQSLVEAQSNNDDELLDKCLADLKPISAEFTVFLDESVDWEESFVEGYAEFPVVTQTFKVFWRDKLAYEGERQYGSSLEDPTHTGLAAEWVAVRIDQYEHVSAEQALECLGLAIEQPVVPPAR